MGGLDTEARIAFTADGETLRVRDLIEGKEMVVEADREIDPVPALTDLFVFPVDRAVSFETESIHLLSHSMVRVRDGEGEFLGNLLEPTEYPTRDYLFDVTGNVRTYVRVEDRAFAASGRNQDGSFTVEFDEPTTVTVGSRSLHTRPEATIVVPDEPTAAMEAVSHLGSSIKEFSAERSWPTLRGHPPRIRRGDRLEIPDLIQRPETGIRIEVPPEYPDVYRVAPLAFYLGASVDPGDAAELHLENGYIEPLRSPDRSLSETVEELLKRCLLLDSLVRIEGYIPSRRLEYEELGPDLPFYPPNLYDATLSEQLLEYLEVDRSVLEPYYPNWSTTAVLRPDPADVELLPYLAHTLSPVRVCDSPGDSKNGEKTAGTVPYGWPDGRIPDSPTDASTLAVTAETLPSNAALLNVETYENAFDLPPVPPGEAAVALVTDSPERGRRWREQLRGLSDGDVGIGAIEVVVRPDCDRFRALFDGSYDVVYVSAPMEGSDIACADGFVTLGKIENVESRFVAFESGPSVEQSATVVRNGAVAAAVIEDTVSYARLRQFLELLGLGLSLGTSSRLVFSDGPNQVQLVGEPGHQVAMNKDATALYTIDIDPVGPDRHRVTTSGFLSVRHRAGEVQQFDINCMDDRAHLLGTRRNDHPLITRDELLQLTAFDDSVIATPDMVTADPERFTEEDVKREVRRSR